MVCALILKRAFTVTRRKALQYTCALVSVCALSGCEIVTQVGSAGIQDICFGYSMFSKGGQVGKCAPAHQYQTASRQKQYYIVDSSNKRIGILD